MVGWEVEPQPHTPSTPAELCSPSRETAGPFDCSDGRVFKVCYAVNASCRTQVLEKVSAELMDGCFQQT